jgi:hypothetical protein
MDRKISQWKQCQWTVLDAVLQIRDVYPGSDLFPSRIPDLNFSHPGSRIYIKEFKYFNPQNCFLSSRKYDPGLFIPGSRGQKGTGSATLPRWKFFSQPASFMLINYFASSFAIWLN